CRRKEIGAVIETRAHVTNKPQVHFMHQGRRLKRVIRTFSVHAHTREFSQFFIHAAKELFRSSRLSFFYLVEEPGDVSLFHTWRRSYHDSGVLLNRTLSGFTVRTAPVRDP